MILANQLGMIPSWQFDRTWPQNPNFNHHVIYQNGMTQMTIQPRGPDYAPPEEAVVGDAGVYGLGARRMGRGEGCCDGGPQPDGCCDPYTGRSMPGGIATMGPYRGRRPPQMNITEYGLPATGSVKTFRGMGSPLDFFESPAWTHRKWFVVGGVALLGLAAIGGLTAILR